MKTNKTFVVMFTLWGMIVFSSCNNDDVAPVGGDDVEVSFTAAISRQSVEKSSETRVSGSSWEVNDAIGIFMFKSDDKALLAMNKKHEIITADGPFSAADGHKIYYPANGTIVDFFAYYPYTEGEGTGGISIDGTTLDLDVTNQNDQGQIDLLWAKSSEGYTKNQGSAVVDLEFNHMLTKLIINVKADAGVDIPNDMVVTIEDIFTKNKFDLSTGLQDVPSDKASITVKKIDTSVGYAASYEAILIPNDYTANAVKVNFATTGNTFVWELGVDFLSKNKYTYNVTLKPTGVEAGRGSIVDWKDNTDDVDVN